MHVRILVATALFVAGCSKPAEEAAPLPTGEAWAEGVNAWRTKHETDYRRDWATIAGLHFLESQGVYSIGSSKENEIVLPDDLPANIGRIFVAEGAVRYEPAVGVRPLLNGKPVMGGVVLKERKKDPDVEVTVQDVKFAVHKSGSRLSLRVWDPDGKQAKEFAGFDWFPIDPNYQVRARFIPDEKTRFVPVLNTYNDPDMMPTEGVVEFTLNGETIRLRPFTTRPKRFWFVFRDGSSGHETYETARFLYSDLNDDGTTVLDFNQAYNPPCAFNKYTTCPIPIKENRLTVKILAGEKRRTKAMNRVVAAFVVLVAAGPVLRAHHGDAGRYDEEVITVTGTVVALQMVNPHTHIIFDVVENGKTVHWQAELGTPQQLIRNFGWAPSTVKAGMKLTMIGRRLKGNAPYLNLTERANIVVTDTGKEIYRTENFGKPAPAKGPKGSFIAQ